MKKKEASVLLTELIALKETEFEAEGKLLREHAHKTFESLKPVNIIKSAFHEVASAPDLKSKMINAAIGFTTGFVAKKIFVGKTHNPLTTLLGVILEMAVSTKVASHADGIRSILGILLKKIMKQPGDPEKM